MQSLAFSGARVGDPLLGRQHYKRLRWYFKAADGTASLADNVDLNLASLGLIERVERMGGGVWFRITAAGTAELAAENQREINRRHPHHALAGRVSQWLRDNGRATWENIQFIVEVGDGEKPRRQAVRPDVFSLATTCNPANICPHVYEIKVSRSDFLADVARPEKRSGYAAIAERVFYVAPAGVVSVEDCPEECGLVFEDDGVFTVVKKAKRRKVALGAEHFMNLILKQGNVPPLV